jgi:hypothetical protein
MKSDNIFKKDYKNWACINQNRINRKTNRFDLLIDINGNNHWANKYKNK